MFSVECVFVEMVEVLLYEPVASTLTIESRMV